MIAEAASSAPTLWAVLEMFEQPVRAEAIETWRRHDVSASLVGGARGVHVFSGVEVHIEAGPETGDFSTTGRRHHVPSRGWPAVVDGTLRLPPLGVSVLQLSHPRDSSMGAAWASVP